MLATLSKTLLLALVSFNLCTPSAFACGDYLESYECSSKLIKRAKLYIQKDIVDGFGAYKFQLGVGPFFKKQYFFVDDNKWITFDKTNVKATFTSKTRCEGSTLVSETYTDYSNWSKRIYDDIEIIQNSNGSLTINTKFWTEKDVDNGVPTKKPYQWRCK